MSLSRETPLDRCETVVKPSAAFKRDTAEDRFVFRSKNQDVERRQQVIDGTAFGVMFSSHNINIV